MPQHVLEGSERQPLKGARSLGKADPAERLEVTVLLQHRGADVLRERVKKLHLAGGRAEHINREDFAQQFGADPGDIEAVKKFAKSHDLTVVQESPARRAVVLAGTVAQFNRAFGVELQRFEHEGGSYRGRTGPIHLSDELHGKVEGVFGLDDRPQAKPHFRGRAQGNVQWRATSTSFTPIQMASLYDYPSGTGQGECIALIELGGGYRPADLTTYFSKLGVPLPKVSAVSVDHGKNSPTGDSNGPDGEVMLDIEVSGAIAPAARIAVYFAPNTDQGFLDAVSTAIHDTTNKPSVISISWGGPESSWTQQSLSAFDQAFQAAATMGITVCVAAGDNGSSDGASGNNVDFPASDPYVLACGGTSVQASGNSITSETVWNDGAQGGAGGGGISTAFPRPPYQEGLSAALTAGGAETLAKRGVPDVAGDADEDTGYDVRVDGSDTVIGGTSAVAPLWAGLIARINSANGQPAGYLNPTLYQNQSAFNDITKGNNGTFAAAAGWDACTGMGSPIGTRIASVIKGKSASKRA
ncbi:MAG: protease pro-enzyme activation domain-containing protein [Candidatus Binataceae bacterium]